MGADTAAHAREVVDALAHRGEFFRVLQQTARRQTAVMTIGPGEDAGPEEQHAGDHIIYVVEGEALVRIAGRGHRAGPGALVTIPARTHLKDDRHQADAPVPTRARPSPVAGGTAAPVWTPRC